jgi:hypothetical protein
MHDSWLQRLLNVVDVHLSRIGFVSRYGYKVLLKRGHKKRCLPPGPGGNLPELLIVVSIFLLENVDFAAIRA